MTLSYQPQVGQGQPVVMSPMMNTKSPFGPTGGDRVPIVTTPTGQIGDRDLKTMTVGTLTGRIEGHSVMITTKMTPLAQSGGDAATMMTVMNHLALRVDPDVRMMSIMSRPVRRGGIVGSDTSQGTRVVIR